MDREKFLITFPFMYVTYSSTCIQIVFFSPMPPHVLMNLRGFPPGCGDSVADF